MPRLSAKLSARKASILSWRRDLGTIFSGCWWARSKTRPPWRKAARIWKLPASKIRSCENTELALHSFVPLENLVPLEPPMPAQPRLPEWLRNGATHFPAVHKLKTEFRRLNLHTVCESARCPNMHECWSRGAATFMILGNLCTRGCGFCSVPKSQRPDALDAGEPANVARMAAAMRLRYVVITSVNRDELEDAGSHNFARTVSAVRAAVPAASVEVLTPDFQGDLDAVARVLDAEPHVFNHNLATGP